MRQAATRVIIIATRLRQWDGCLLVTVHTLALRASSACYRRAKRRKCTAGHPVAVTTEGIASRRATRAAQ